MDKKSGNAVLPLGKLKWRSGQFMPSVAWQTARQEENTGAKTICYIPPIYGLELSDVESRT